MGIKLGLIPQKDLRLGFIPAGFIPAGLFGPSLAGRGLSLSVTTTTSNRIISADDHDAAEAEQQPYCWGFCSSVPSER